MSYGDDANNDEKIQKKNYDDCDDKEYTVSQGLKAL
jgi:hypothetical protein